MVIVLPKRWIVERTFGWFHGLVGDSGFDDLPHQAIRRGLSRKPRHGSPAPPGSAAIQRRHRVQWAAADRCPSWNDGWGQFARARAPIVRTIRTRVRLFHPIS
jgi:hypothetical protein